MIDSISNSAAGFSRALMDMSDYVDGSIDKVIRKACIDLYRRIAERTPVDSGRAKASWMLSTTETDQTRFNKDGFSYNEIKNLNDSEISGFKFSMFDGVVYIINNLEYIENLENGTSDQAPAGMVMVSLAEFETHFTLALQGLQGLETT